jgi:D-alanyl-lipoteichoic acid acyltransferase DltB (MBOAT superfamily)
MSFDSLTFLIFLPTVLLLHWITPHRFRWTVLLTASIVFYASWNIPLTLLLFGVIAVTYFSGLMLSRSDNHSARRIILIASLLICIGLLLYFKYFNFLGESLYGLLRLFGGKGRFKPLAVILPVGVSFYTFQALSYVIDVYRGDIEARRHFGYYALFVSFFPQLVAGPIERADALIPQLERERQFSIDNLRIGCRYLLCGYFRKIVIADFCGVFVNAVYALEKPDGFAVLIATVLFAFQIYCDFSGYSEIAKGAAKCLGVELIDNFERPYLSASFREFWRRWHISLSRWFTDYVYIPLGGSRRGMGRRIFATLIVFALSGLWHGADATFLIWGLLHGALMAAEILLSGKFTVRKSGKGIRFIRTAVVFLLVCFAWIFFRAEDIAQAGTFLSQLFSPWNIGEGVAQLGMSLTDMLWIALSLCALPIIYRLRSRTARDITYILLLVSIAFAWLNALSQNTQSAFIYFQF